MKAKAIYLGMIFLLLATKGVYAQFDYLNIYAGTSVFPKDEKRNAAGQPENIFGGYSQAIVIGGGVDKYFTDNIGAAANIDFSYTSKTHYKFSQLKINALMKYCFYRYSTVSPYVFVGGNLAFVSINRSAYSETITPDKLYSTKDSSDVPVSLITINYPESSYSFVPVFGFAAGAGASVRANEWFSVFAEYSFDYYLSTQSPVLKANFSYNTTNLNTSTIRAGVKIDLY